MKDSVLLCAKTAVLTTTPDVIRKLKITQDNTQDTELHKFLDEHLYKSQEQLIWLIYEDPWWSDVFNLTYLHTISDSPIREVYGLEIPPFHSSLSHDSFSNNIDLPVISIKLNNKYRPYWEGLNRGKVSHLENETESTLPVLFLNHVKLHLCNLFGVNCSLIPNPVSYLVHKWNGQLFGQTYYVWKAGINVEDTVNYLSKPFKNHNLHFVGFWYQDMKNQADNLAGDLDAVQNLFGKYLNV